MAKNGREQELFKASQIIEQSNLGYRVQLRFCLSELRGKLHSANPYQLKHYSSRELPQLIPHQKLSANLAKPK